MPAPSCETRFPPDATGACWHVNVAYHQGHHNHDRPVDDHDRAHAITIGGASSAAADDNDREPPSPSAATTGIDSRNLSQQRCPPEAPPELGIGGVAPLGSRVSRTLRRILALTRQCAQGRHSAHRCAKPFLPHDRDRRWSVSIVVPTACFPQTVFARVLPRILNGHHSMNWRQSPVAALRQQRSVVNGTLITSEHLD
jgi:hypothetical protein